MAYLYDFEVVDGFLVGVLVRVRFGEAVSVDAFFITKAVGLGFVFGVTL